MKYIILLPELSSKTIDFAGSQLAYYLQRITGFNAELLKFKDRNIGGRGYGFIFLGRYTDFSGFKNVPSFKESRWDDSYYISCNKQEWIISGSNGRSILYGVYHLLQMFGCKWAEPGQEEFIPFAGGTLKTPSQPVFEKAAFRYRGIDLAARNLCETLQALDWMSKHRMNHCFLELNNLFERYNIFYKRPVLSYQAIEEENAIFEEIQKRGFIIERFGHGWLNGAFDIPSVPEIADTPAEKRNFLAEVNGKRELWNEKPLDTQMCLSNTEGMKKVVEYVTKTGIETYPLDILAFWLGDGMNNLCECCGCRKIPPGNRYIKMVYEIFKAVNKQRPDIKIEFIAYANILQPPDNLSILNDCLDNLILNFAPITRCYSHSLGDLNCFSKNPYACWPEINFSGEPKNGELRNFLLDWRSKFKGDIYIFDYYFWPAATKNFLFGFLPETIVRDCSFYEETGINGVISCQKFSSFFPTGFEMTLLAENLWHPSKNWQNMLKKYIKNLVNKTSADWINDIYKSLKTIAPSRKDIYHAEIFSTNKIKMRANKALNIFNSFKTQTYEFGTELVFLRFRIFLEYLFLRLKILAEESENNHANALREYDNLEKLLIREYKCVNPVVDIDELLFILRQAKKRWEK